MTIHLDWVDTFARMEGSFRQRLKEQLEIRYAKFPAGKKRGRSSHTTSPGPRANRRRSAALDDPDVQDEVSGPRPAVGGAGGEGLDFNILRIE